MLLDVKECLNVSFNCIFGKCCIEIFGGFECICVNSFLYGENCIRGEWF